MQLHLHTARAAIIALALLFTALPAAALEVRLNADSAAINRPFDVNFYINNTSDLYGAGFDLLYDPALVEAVDGDDAEPGIQPVVVESGFLSESGMQVTIGLAGLQDDTSGRLVVGLVRRGNVAGLDVAQERAIFTLRMRGVSVGTANLGIDNLYVQNSAGAVQNIDQSSGDQVAITENPAPVFSPVAAQAVDEGQPLSFAVSASDPDGGTVLLSVTGLPSGATFNANSGVFNWTPGFDAAGSYQVTFTATDDDAPQASAQLDVAITVRNVNRAPELAAVDDQVVEAGDPVSFTVSATDPDGDSITLSAENVPAGATFDAGTGEFSWTPAEADAGSHPITFTATDDGTPPLSDSATATISVTTAAGNQPPVLQPIGNQSVNAGETLSFTVAATDPDAGDTVTLSAQFVPPTASWDSATGAFSWTPTPADAGTRFVTFTATDSGTPPLSDSETIQIAVQAVNNPPELTPIGNQTVTAGEELAFNISATDPDGDGLTLGAQNLPGGAQFNLQTGAFAWTPDEDDVGEHEVTFSVSDDGIPSQSDSETITITVEAVCGELPDAPANVQATDGTRDDGVEITWDAVAQAGAEYIVYRGSTDSFDSAAALSAWTSDTSYLDTTADPPEEREVDTGGCGGPKIELDPVIYYYWVMARIGESCEGEPSLSDAGDRGASEEDDDEEDKDTVYAPALPGYIVAEGEVVDVPSDARLAVRLRADAPIVPDSVWGHVTWSTGSSDQTEWLAVDDQGADLWLLFTPGFRWDYGEVIYMSGGGRTADGKELAVEWRFQVESESAAAHRIESRQKGPEQPAVAFDAIEGGAEIHGLELRVVDDAGLPALRGARDAAYALAPEGAYEAPRYVWLPLPEDAAPQQVELFYYHAVRGESGWYGAESVEGFVVEDTWRVGAIGAQRYLGVAVRHGGIVQLALAASAHDAAAMSPMPAGSPLRFAGNLLMLIGVAAVLALWRRRHGGRA